MRVLYKSRFCEGFRAIAAADGASQATRLGVPFHVSVDVSNHLPAGRASFPDTVGTISTEAMVRKSVNCFSAVQAADAIPFPFALFLIFFGRAFGTCFEDFDSVRLLLYSAHKPKSPHILSHLLYLNLLNRFLLAICTDCEGGHSVARVRCKMTTTLENVWVVCV